MKEIKRGEIYSADFGAGFGSEQGGIRSILILQNNTGNKHSPTTIVAAITSRKTKIALPTHVTVTANGLKNRIHRPARANPNDRQSTARRVYRQARQQDPLRR